MAAFKELFNKELIQLTAQHLKRAHLTFDEDQFINLATHELDGLELKERALKIFKDYIIEGQKNL